MAGEIDLHLHTTASDGRLAPAELVRLTVEQGLKQISISDHDSTEGLAEALEEAQKYPELRIIPGIELSTDIPGDEIHMLGYFIDYQDNDFQGILKRFRSGRLDRAKEMVEKLATLGIVLDWERVKEIAGDGSVGRPHIALAMVEQGYCKEPKDAFPEYLGRNGLAYAERPKMTPTEGVEMLRRVGGVPVLAHPAYMNDLESNIAALKEAGLMGMEVYYAKFDADTVRRLKSLADKFGLIPCGGSDFHGLGNSDEALPGTAGPPISTIAQLEEASDSISRTVVS
jgi:predicted metal-dependent phosphoesterase TrpH